jgi:hypothetical protein
MKKPASFTLKEWLCDNSIRGLIIHYYQTGTDTSDTDWELIPSEGKPKRVKADKVKDLVTVRPDWARVMTVTTQVVKEVQEYREFCKREAVDLAEYERLKKKFGA